MESLRNFYVTKMIVLRVYHSLNCPLVHLSLFAAIKTSVALMHFLTNEIRSLLNLCSVFWFQNYFYRSMFSTDVRSDSRSIPRIFFLQPGWHVFGWSKLSVLLVLAAIEKIFLVQLIVQHQRSDLTFSGFLPNFWAICF